jgi:hypothetical protein
MSPGRHLALRYSLPGAGFVAIAVWYGDAGTDVVLRTALALGAAAISGAAFFFAVDFFAAYVPFDGSDELQTTSLLREGPAAYAEDDTPRMGRLALTPATLTFFEGGLLSADHGRTWNVRELRSVHSDDAIHLTLHTGAEVTLEVPDVAEWCAALEAAIVATNAQQ